MPPLDRFVDLVRGIINTGRQLAEHYRASHETGLPELGRWTPAECCISSLVARSVTGRDQTGKLVAHRRLGDLKASARGVKQQYFVPRVRGTMAGLQVLMSQKRVDETDVANYAAGGTKQPLPVR